MRERNHWFAASAVYLFAILNADKYLFAYF